MSIVTYSEQNSSAKSAQHEISYLPVNLLIVLIVNFLFDTGLLYLINIGYVKNNISI